MKVKVISKGPKKTEIIVIEPTDHGDVRTTRHLLLKAGRWTDKHGNVYDLH